MTDCSGRKKLSPGNWDFDSYSHGERCLAPSLPRSLSLSLDVLSRADSFQESVWLKCTQKRRRFGLASTARGTDWLKGMKLLSLILLFFPLPSLRKMAPSLHRLLALARGRNVKWSVEKGLTAANNTIAFFSSCRHISQQRSQNKPLARLKIFRNHSNKSIMQTSPKGASVTA